MVCFTESPVPCHDPAKDTERGKNNLPPETSLWSVTEVMSFFSSLGFPEEAKSFQNQVSFFFLLGKMNTVDFMWPNASLGKVESEITQVSHHPRFLGDLEFGKSFSWMLCICLLTGL